MALDLSQKVGPLPLWGWGGAVLLGLGYEYYKSKKAASSTAATPTSLTANGGTTTDSGYSTATTPGVGGAASLTADQFPSVTPGTSAPQTNTDWTNLAQSILVGRGYDPFAVATALGLYLSGQQLTPAQQDIVSEALRLAGAAPAPPSIISTPSTGTGATGTSAATSGQVQPDLPGYPGSGQAWNTFEQNQVASGQFVGQAGTEDWGVIAAGTLPPSATTFDVYVRSKALQSEYPQIFAKYPGYVPVAIAQTIKYTGA